MINSFTPELQKVINKQYFTAKEAYHAFSMMCDTQTPISQRAAFLTLLSMRGEQPEELQGFLTYICEHSLPIPGIDTQQTIDMVGTGGDGLKTFNISTAAALVVASGGVPVAKHGGRAVSSASGSGDVISALGIPHHRRADAIRDSLANHHFVYLLAPFFNSLLKEFSPLRQELGIRTFFNVLGTVANPARVKRQVIGVYHRKFLLPLAELLQQRGSIHAMVIHSDDGMDEISLTADTTIIHLQDDTLKKYKINPQQFGLKRCHIDEISGKDATYNAILIRDIFSGKRHDACRDIVLINAAAGFIVADRCANFNEGIELARHCIDSGATTQLLTQLIRGESHG